MGVAAESTVPRAAAHPSAEKRGEEGNLVGEPLNKMRFHKGYILTVQVTRIRLGPTLGCMDGRG